MSKNIYHYMIEQKNKKDVEPSYAPYSGQFKTKEEALKWYEQHGKWLEKMFNRKLILR